MLSIELSKMYRDGLGEIVLIIGEVAPDTIDYAEGLRFFSCQGIKYRENGKLIYSDTAMDLVREAEGHELNHYRPYKIRYDLLTVKDLPDQYIPYNHPDFVVNPMGRYITRMGLLEDRKNFLCKYSPDGRRFSFGPSMDDIVYQIKDDITRF